ncbi:GGDEF domain-containing protein [Paraglaciecola sp. 20A4]|uniref:GGDEF domain-containing protein n=1 Tax=Paraglaciecola sp. 20A4 TaxID=2687288 RepID=UPI00140A1FC9|nr:GGDEF domain-containing protein [Paraglaciecola sp. 20A4]
MATKKPNVCQSTSKPRTVLSSLIYLLVVGAFAISALFTLDRLIQAQAKVALEVNLGGQQLMLLQRASLFATTYLYSGDRAAKQTSLQALGELQANHQHLLHEHYNALANKQHSPLSNTLQALYFTSNNNVNDQLNLFSEQIYNALNQQEKDNKLDAKILMELTYTPLLNSLRDVVEQYKAQDNKRIATLRLVQVVIFWLIVFVLFIGLVVIFLNARQQQQKIVSANLLNIDSEQFNPTFNRFAFELSASKLIATARRHNEAMSVLAFDIDRYPRILENHGQEVANQILTRVAKIILEVCRESDYLGRVTDEQFILLLPKTSAAQAVSLANKIRLHFQDEHQGLYSNQISLSVSIGVSELGSDDSLLQQIISRAEQALGRRKNEGSARVCVA